MTKARASLRVSTDDQSLGLEAQLHACQVWAAREGFELAGPDIWIRDGDMDRLTGLGYVDEDLGGALPLDKRPALIQAITDLEPGDVLLFAKRDRLGRDPMVIAMIEAAVKRKKCTIASAAGEGTGSDDPASILMRRMVDAFGEYERLVIKTRTKAALAAKARKGERISGRIPYGWGLAGDGVKLVELPYELQAIETMVWLKSEGKSARWIAGELNMRSIPAKEGGLWSGRTVGRILARHARTHKVA